MNATDVVKDLYRNFPDIEFWDESDRPGDKVMLIYDLNWGTNTEMLRDHVDGFDLPYRIIGKRLYIIAPDDYETEYVGEPLTDEEQKKADELFPRDSYLSAFEDDEYDDDRFEEIDSKSVQDSDGFWTDYTMYYDHKDTKFVFVFGDKDLYRPEDGEYDWEEEDGDAAREWFDNYDGIYDDDDNESLKEAKDKKEDPYKQSRERLNIPANKVFKDKSKYDRKEKHKKDLDDVTWIESDDYLNDGWC